jgi:hypothetical protein
MGSLRAFALCIGCPAKFRIVGNFFGYGRYSWQAASRPSQDFALFVYWKTANNEPGRVVFRVTRRSRCRFCVKSVMRFDRLVQRFGEGEARLGILGKSGTYIYV